MSFALACTRPDVFRAVGIYSGGQLSGCSGGNSPVAYYATHGEDDGTLNISGGRTMRDKFVEEQRLHRHESARACQQQRLAHLHVLRRMLGRAPGPLVRVRRQQRPRPVAQGPRPVHDLESRGSLEVLHAVLVALARSASVRRRADRHCGRRSVAHPWAGTLNWYSVCESALPMPTVIVFAAVPLL